MSGQPRTQQVTDEFIWAQWDSQNQRLYLVYPKYQVVHWIKCNILNQGSQLIGDTTCSQEQARLEKFCLYPSFSIHIDIMKIV